MVSTKPSICVQPQTTAFGEPLHCWGTVLADIPFYWKGKAANDLRQTIKSTRLIQMGGYPDSEF